MEKRKAPRPIPRVVKVAPSEAKKVIRRTLGWRQVNTAVQEFLATANDAHDSLVEFMPVTEEHIDWLKSAISVAIEYLDESNNLETSCEVIEFNNALLTCEAEFFAKLLRAMKSYNDDVLDIECPELPEALRKNISELIDDKMEDVERSGWHMYHAFIGAV